MALAPHPNPEAPVLSHFSLEGKTALVTGGCRGIGLEVARGLCEAGAAVGITYSSTPAEEADAIAAKLSAENGGRAVKAYQCNVRSAADVEAVVEAAARDLGGHLEVLVANAGVGGGNAAIDTTDDEFRGIFDVNVNGAFWAARAAARIFERQMKAAGAASHRGSIIFTASVSATLVNVPQKQAAYNASKAALVHLGKSVAVEWVDFARVNSISPGFIETEMLDIHPKEWRSKWTEMTPGGRFCQPSELKGAYVFLASDASSYMTGE
ncbi:NAD(P)-binding protein [Hypoxylon sp. FL1284]|nr:NAD(P)-binding protein [Hypoxylon sp. FL1284]